LIITFNEKALLKSSTIHCRGRKFLAKANAKIFLNPQLKLGAIERHSLFEFGMPNSSVAETGAIERHSLN